MIKGTRETYELGVQHRLGTVIALRAGGELVHVRLDDASGRVLKLTSEEVLYATARDEERAVRVFRGRAGP